MGVIRGIVDTNDGTDCLVGEQMRAQFDTIAKDLEGKDKR